MDIKITKLSFALSIAGLNTLPLSSEAIVGGYSAQQGEHPWFVGVINKVDRENYGLYQAQYCGGTLISPSWVVTAAHCFNSIPSMNVEILLNHTDLLHEDGARISTIDSLIMHPGYDPSTLYDDIALVKLSEPVTDLETLDLTSVSDFESFVDNNQDDSLQIIGWGEVYDEDTGTQFSPSLLQTTHIDYKNQLECATEWGGIVVTEDKFCAEELSPESVEEDDDRDATPEDYYGESFCNGDSGGSAVSKLQEGDRLVGIISDTDHTNCSAKPGLLTRVSVYLDWIENASASAGAALVDLGLTLAATETTASLGTGITLSYTIENKSQNNQITNPALVIPLSNDNITLSPGSGELGCLNTNNGDYLCTTTTPLLPGSTISQDIRVNWAGTDSHIDIEARVSADQEDMRGSSNHQTVQLTFGTPTNSGTGAPSASAPPSSGYASSSGGATTWFLPLFLLLSGARIRQKSKC